MLGANLFCYEADQYLYLLLREGLDVLCPNTNGKVDWTIFPENCIYFVTSHNFFFLSSVQIIIIPACCLLCVL